MILDANLLIYAISPRSAHHQVAIEWLDEHLNGDQRVAIPIQTISAFLRITTDPRISDPPLSPRDAWTFVQEWLDLDIVWIPPASDRTAHILGSLITAVNATGNLITDAQLAATAIEHGISVVSFDSDFARFPDVRWINPLAA